jgi:hypothetical protein
VQPQRVSQHAPLTRAVTTSQYSEPPKVVQAAALAQRRLATPVRRQV